jgi:hypothetical protein
MERLFVLERGKGFRKEWRSSRGQHSDGSIQGDYTDNVLRARKFVGMDEALRHKDDGDRIVEVFSKGGKR